MSNEAAERLRDHLIASEGEAQEAQVTLQEALAAERKAGRDEAIDSFTDRIDGLLDSAHKATVERIRAALDLGPCHECENSDEIHRALDAEAAR
jgi:hypothetical protein